MNKKLFVPKLKNYELLFTAFKVNKYALTNKNFLASPPLPRQQNVYTATTTTRKLYLVE